MNPHVAQFAFVAAVFFAGGWAFFKHRAQIKAAAKAEAAAIAKSVKAEESKAEAAIKSKF